MRPTTLTVEGFQGYRDSQRIDLSDVSRASITGRVGSGKSSILDAINFALYGKVRVPTQDGVIHTAAARATVELEFTEHDGRYKATRALPRSGSTKAYLWCWDDTTCDWVAAGDPDGRVGVTDAAIRDLIGLPWEAFRASVIVEQGSSAGFADAKPSERHELLAEIVGLSRYATLAAAAGDARKDVRLTITRTQTRLEEHTAVLADADQVAVEHTAAIAHLTQLAQILEQAEAAVIAAGKDEQVTRARLDLASQQANTAAVRVAADNAIMQAASAAQRAQRIVDDLTARAGRRAEAAANRDKAIASHTRATTELAAVAAQGEQVRADLDAATTERAHVNEAIAVLTERLAGLTHDSDGCFTCGQPLTSAQRAKVVNDLTDERARLRVSVADLDQQIDRAKHARASAQDQWRQTNSAVQTFQRAIDEFLRPLADSEQAAVELPAAREHAASTQSALAEAQAARANIPDLDDVDLPGAQSAWERATKTLALARDHVTQAKDRRAHANTNLAVLADRMARHATARQAVESLTTQLADLRKEEERWGLLIEAFSPSGVPRMILDTAIADINVDLDQELSNLSGGTLTASLDTMRTTKSGSMRSEITLTVTGQDGARSYESFSGGQRFLVDLALHLALTKTLARRHGSTLDFLAVDEGWGSLEGEEREAVLRSLHAIAEDHGALLLAITHVAEVAESFPTRIETEMLSGTSVTTVC